MNILVLGGTRFSGKTLVEQLGSAGHAVTVLSRGKVPPPAGAAHLVVDRADPAALAAALVGRSFDVVIDNVAMTAAHVGGALDAIGDRTGHYVLTSTASVHGDFAHGRVWRESDLDLAELERPMAGGHAYTIGERAAEASTVCVEIPREILRCGALAAEELPFGEDGSTWACDTTRLEHELGITPTPAATWLGELVRGPAVARGAEDEARRAAELAIARAHRAG